MLDLKFIREHSDEVTKNVRLRKAKANVEQVIDLDNQRIELVQQIGLKRQELNRSSKEKPSPERIEELRQLGDEVKTLELRLAGIEKELQAEASLLPNMSSPDMPVGAGEPDNIELKVWLPEHGYVNETLLGTNDELKYLDLLPRQELDGLHARQHHLDVGEALGIIDMTQAAKVSGSRFAYLLGEAMLLQNAIVQLLSQKLLSHGFSWVDPPLLVRERVMFGTSHFPEGRDQVYQISAEHVEEGRELFLVGSSEPPLFAYGMDRVFTEAELPLKMFAVTPCFRSEVGSWGKDVRGIKRVHQFTKLEMDVICLPGQSAEIFEELSGYNEWLLQELQLPYRLLNKCTGDCGYLATYKQYDVEVWMPSQQAYMETMTDTNATDFQARRLGIKYESTSRQVGELARGLVHTVNDTGAAMGRLIAAILDNYQQADGSVIVPDALRPWVGQDRIGARS